MADIDVGQVLEQLNNKVDLPTGDSQDGIDFVVDWQKPTEENGYTWYRKYKSGWVEQGGIVDGTSKGYQSITLPLEMANTHFNLSITRQAGTSTNVVNVWGQNPNTSGSTTTIAFYASEQTGIFWQVCGMGA